MYDIVALGELLIDFAQVETDRAGYPTLAAQPGGAPANFLAAAARYGRKTALLGKVGADAFGDLLRRTLGAQGIGTQGLVADPAFFTTLAFVTLDETGDRSFSFARKPGADAMLRPEELELSLLDGARLFHFGTLSLTHEPARSATRAALAAARDRGLLISCDPNLRLPLWRCPEDAKRAMLWAAEQADVVKLSGEELRFLWDCSPEEGAERLLDLGVKLALVTLGPEGCLVQNSRAAVRLSAPPVQAVDTTGAGDIFGGAAVSRLLALDRPPELLERSDLGSLARFATAAASLSTQTPGGIPSVPDQSAVEALAHSAAWG